MTRSANEAVVIVRGTVEALFYASPTLSAGRLCVTELSDKRDELKVRFDDQQVLYAVETARELPLASPAR